jgi:nucleoid-associated protein YgaU
MPNDVKVGLVGGVGLLLLACLCCFRKDFPTVKPGAPAAFHAPVVGPSTPAPIIPRPAPASSPASSTGKGYWHRVQPGDSLIGLAQRFYGDGDRFVDIYNANRHVLTCPDPLPHGTVLLIPDVVEASPSAPR